MKNCFKDYLAGKHAVVLGASGGIGSAVARAYAESGVSALTLTYGKSKERAEELAQELREQGVKVFVSPLDRSEPATVVQFFESAVREIGQEVDIMTDTIGISPDTPLIEQTPELWDQVYRVNVTGCFVSTRALAERMKAKGVKGVIVVITSTNGINAQQHYSMPYDTSKAGQNHLILNIAEAYAPDGIRILGVAPGWIDTEMNVTLPKGEYERQKRRTWMQRFAQPEEIAEPIVFFSGPSASFMTGTIVVIDGGYR